MGIGFASESLKKYIPPDSIPGMAHLNHLLISETCKQLGSYPAQNAFGIRMMVHRQACERFFVSDGDVLGPAVGGTRIKMTAAQFRQIRKFGVETEVFLTLGYPNKDVTVSFRESVDTPKISHPFETKMSVWTLYGRFDEIRWIVLGEQPVLFWRSP